MTASSKELADDAARAAALTVYDRSLLVEAGAGSGKTAIMAGRIALMLASGIPPSSIAAVTFTELAASELLTRVRTFVESLAADNVPPELRVAVPLGLSPAQLANLRYAGPTMDELTCSTIHGFCQRLIKPYPVEADIDPGAMLMDRDQADLAFLELVETWLRERLAGVGGELIADLVVQDPKEAVGLIQKILNNVRHRRAVTPPASTDLPPLVSRFRDKVAAFGNFMQHAVATEEETLGIAQRFGAMADALNLSLTDDEPATLIQLVRREPHPALCTATGSFRAYQRKGKWGDAAKRAGISKADGERLNLEASGHYAECCNAWDVLLENAASRVLSALLEQVQPVLQHFRDYKRAAGLLDFDDLIFSARDLLRDHDTVRRALGKRYAFLLVDEFQDTDPLQTEIFWRLCGEPPASAPSAGWEEFQIRPGALFLVGDPKQAIYRFRGADVLAYVRARAAFVAQDPRSVLSISTNFRSCASILAYVNKHFQGPLSSPAQPGFTALNAFHSDRGDGLCVAALNVSVADTSGRATVDRQRDGEAEAVAQMCARLIGSELVMDHKSNEHRPCRPGDIALLAPTGSDLWRYEEALERYGIPVATQAGKGLFRRQELQDLIALTRVLADARDTLALGALLRGPLVGLTEEELLDILWALPALDDPKDDLSRLRVGVDPRLIAHPLVRDILTKLQALRRNTNGTTPHHLLSEAIDVLRVRPILLQRHRGQAARALANVDLYLTMSRAYGVRGLRAFAEVMTAAWSDESRAVEGRPDAQEEAVALYTMHAAKGLEWPIVIPVNTMTVTKSPDSVVFERNTNRFYCPVFGVRPVGYEAAREAEKAELERERIRLWYVAATRARELLVVPRLDAAASSTAWISLLNMSLSDLPAIDLSHHPEILDASGAIATNNQDRESFAAEAKAITAAHVRLTWVAPSRDEGANGPVMQAESASLGITRDAAAVSDATTPASVQGGRERGLIIHKLLEEVLTGEAADSSRALRERAAALILGLGQTNHDDPAAGLSATELAGCVASTLSLPEIASIRPTLLPECPVYSDSVTEDSEEAVAGIADAVSLSADSSPQLIVDWKSDVDPTPDAIGHYRSQVRKYLETTGAKKGLIVFVTSGKIVPVSATGTT